MIILKSPQEIEKMRTSCRIVADILIQIKQLVRPGVTTSTLDKFAENEARTRGAKPAFKGYRGYKYSLCCSVNDQVVHGMPCNKELNAGDIISLDFGVLYDGFYGDAAITLPVGKVDARSQRLIDITEQSLFGAIKYAVPGGRLSDISNAVQSYVELRGFSVVRDFVGHGIGRSLHENPQVPNYGQPGKGPKLKSGMVLAIEPMINEKGYEVRVEKDGWTAVTCDGGLSAHCEHTVAITENGPEILTISH